MDKKYKILFVCLGNICRSPSAETLFRHTVERAGYGECFEIDSAGLIDCHAGEGADGRMKAHAARRGYRITSVSRPVVPEDFDRFDLIVGMDDRNIRELIRRAENEEQRAKIRKMTEFSQKFAGTEEVPDPYYGGAEGFERVLDLLEDASEGLLNKLKPGC